MEFNKLILTLSLVFTQVKIYRVRAIFSYLRLLEVSINFVVDLLQCMCRQKTNKKERLWVHNIWLMFHEFLCCFIGSCIKVRFSKSLPAQSQTNTTSDTCKNKIKMNTSKMFMLHKQRVYIMIQLTVWNFI